MSVAQDKMNVLSLDVKVAKFSKYLSGVGDALGHFCKTAD